MVPRGVTTSSNKDMVGTTSNRATMPTNSRVSTVPSNRDMAVTVTTRVTASSKDTANNSKDMANRDSSKPASRGTARLLKDRTGSSRDTVSSSRVRTVPSKGMDNNSRIKLTRVTSKVNKDNRASSKVARKLWEITASRTAPTTAQ